MQFVELKALRMQSSTQSLLKVLWKRVRSGENPELTTREKHERECFVVLEEGADAATVEKEIKRNA